MGSASDEEAVQPTLNTLESLGVEYEVRVMSAHRTPERVHEYASTARDRGLEVLIAAAGGSAAGDWHPADIERAQRVGRPAVDGANAARHTGRGDGRGRLGRAQRRLLRRADPGDKARQHPRIRREVPPVSP